MKAQIIPYPPPPREVVVTMSEEEASRLYRVAYQMSASGWNLGHLRNIQDELMSALYAAGVR